MAGTESGLDLEAMRRMREERQKRIEDMKLKSALREQQKKAAAEKTVKPFGLDDLLRADSDTDDTGSTLSPLAAPTRPVTMADARRMSDHSGPSRGPHPPLESSTNSGGVLHVRVSEGRISRSASTASLFPPPAPAATPTPTGAGPGVLTAASPRNQPARPITPRPYPAAPGRLASSHFSDPPHSPPPAVVVEPIAPPPMAPAAPYSGWGTQPPAPLPRSDSLRSLEYEVPCVDRATQTVTEVATQTETLVCPRAACACLHLHPAEPHPRRCAICDGADPPARRQSNGDDSAALARSVREWQLWWQKVAVFLAEKAEKEKKAAVREPPPPPTAPAAAGPPSAAAHAALQQRLRQLRALLKEQIAEASPSGSGVRGDPRAGLGPGHSAPAPDVSLVYSPYSTTYPASSGMDWAALAPAPHPLSGAVPPPSSRGSSGRSLSGEKDFNDPLKAREDATPPAPRSAGRASDHPAARPTEPSGAPQRSANPTFPHGFTPPLTSPVPIPYPFSTPGHPLPGYHSPYVPFWGGPVAPPPGSAFSPHPLQPYAPFSHTSPLPTDPPPPTFSHPHSQPPV